MEGVRSASFKTLSLPPQERIQRYEAFLKESSKTAVGDCNRLLFQSLGGDNPDYVEHERLIADDFTLSVTDTSGLIMTGETRIPRSSIVVNLISKGEAELRLPAQTHAFKQGDICISTAETDYQLTVNPSEVARIMLPHGIFKDLPDNLGNLVILRSTNPIAEILHVTARRMLAEFRAGNHRHLGPMSRIARQVIRASLLEDRNATLYGGHALLRIRTRHFVENNIASPGLNVGDIAEHLNTSRATLYRSFKDHGGVREFINRVRLEAARKMLHTMGPQRGHLLYVAHACGFSSPSHFSRAFKKQFGMPPGAFALRSIAGVPNVPADSPEL